MSQRIPPTSTDLLSEVHLSQIKLPLRFLTLGKLALLVAVAGMAYLPALHGDFIFDDDLLLTDNALIKAPDGLARIWFTSEPVDYWPVANSNLWLEWRLWGMNSTGYHVTNLLLHLAAVVLIWAILVRLSIPGAFLAALLFAVHPVNVESVAWISQRKGLLASVFFLLSILSYLRDGQQHGATDAGQGSIPQPRKFARFGRWYWLSLLAFLLALLSKGSVTVLPVVLLLISWWQWRRVGSYELLRTAPFFLLAIVFTALNIWFQTHGADVMVRDASLAQRLAGAGSVVWFYLSKALLPLDLVFIYPLWNIQITNLCWWLPLLSASAVTVALFCQSRSPSTNWIRSLFFAWGFYCVALMPVMGFADVGFMHYSLVADHYLYLGLIGVSAAAAAGWTTWQQRSHGAMRPAAIAVAIAIVSTLAVLTWNQCRLYGDPITLYEATLEANPDCWMAHTNLGIALAAAGRRQEAMQHYQRTLGLNADTAQTHFDLGNALMATGQPQEAAEHYQRSLQLRSDYAKTHYCLARALLAMGRSKEALEQYQQALKLKPDFAEARYELGALLNDSGQLREAVELFARNMQSNPNSAEAQNNYAWMLATSAVEQFRDPSLAVQLAKKAINLDPKRVDFFNTLGVAYYRAANWQDAIEWLNKSTNARDGGDIFDWFFLAMAHERLGHHAEAHKWYDQAVKWLEKHEPHNEELLRLCRETKQLLAGESAVNTNPEKSK